MSKVVWKFPLKSMSRDGDRAFCEIEMPGGAEVLLVGAQTGEPCLWALVDLDAQHHPRPKQTRRFAVLGTGHEGPGDVDRKRYIGTFFSPTDTIGTVMGLPPVLVFHVFDLGWRYP